MINITPIFGYVAGALTSIALLPQLIRSWKTKHTKDVSLAMLLVFITGILFWFIYGVLTNNQPIIITNIITLIINILVLILKLKYK